MRHDETWLYTVEDETGAVLYVGITSYLRSRLGTHRRKKAWWHEARYVHGHLYACRADALAWESVCIHDGTPYNVDIPPLRPLRDGWNPNTSALATLQFVVGENL